MKSKFFLRLTALTVTACMMFSNQPWTIAAAEAEQAKALSKTYMSEVKVFYAENADQAKQFCANEGYLFCPTNLNEGGKNQWSSSDHAVKTLEVYLGYKTTKDPSDAITDISLLDMKNSYYQTMNYGEYLDKYIGEFHNQAEKYLSLVKEYQNKYAAGSPKAIAACDSLNMFYVKEEIFFRGPSDPQYNGNLLGNYLLKNDDITLFEKLLQRGNAQVVNKIISILCQAAADYDSPESIRAAEEAAARAAENPDAGITVPKLNKTWIDRAKVSEIVTEYERASSSARSEYNTMFQDTARKLVKEILTFSELYNEAMNRLETYGETLGYGDGTLTADSSLEELMELDPNCMLPEYVDAIRTYTLLNGITYQTKGEVIVSNAYLLEDDDEDEDEDEDDTEDNTGDTAETEIPVDAEPAASAESAEAEEPEEIGETVEETVSLAKYLMDLAAKTTNTSVLYKLYPFVQGMTAAQRIVLEEQGLRGLVEGLYQLDDYMENREKYLQESADKLREYGFVSGKLDIWAGVDKSVYGKLVAETDDEIKAELAGIELKNYENEAERKANNNLMRVLEWVDVSTMIVSGVALLTQALIGKALWTAGIVLIRQLAVSVVSAVFGVLVCALQILNIAAFAISIALMVFMLLKSQGVFDRPEKISYEEMPEMVFHRRTVGKTNYGVRYEAIPSNATKELFKQFNEPYKDELKQIVTVGGGMSVNFKVIYRDAYETTNLNSKVADMNAFQSQYDRWITMYYSKSPAIGDPIVVPENEPLIKLQNFYQAPEGYRGITLIDNVTAADVNDVEVGGQKGPSLYLFIPGESTSVGSAVKEETDQTINAVSISYAETAEGAKSELTAQGYLIIEENLTPENGFTYLGFKYGSSEPLTDLRVSTVGTDSIEFGGASYSRGGTKKHGITENGVCLYYTTSPCAGTPITKIEVTRNRLPLGNKDGKEPVCLFSGGNAYDFGHSWLSNALDIDYVKEEDEEEYYLFFIRSHNFNLHLKEEEANYFVGQDDLDNGRFIYFTPTEKYISPEEKAKAENPDMTPEEAAKLGTSEPPYVAGFSYFLAADKTSGRGFKGDNYAYMQELAEKNGFELVKENGSPIQLMTDQAGEMTLALHWKDLEGTPVNTWVYEQVHTLLKGTIMSDSDNGGPRGFQLHEYLLAAESRLTRYKKFLNDNKGRMLFHTRMYFGVSYTYNPYRAITGVSGLITEFTESMNHSLRYTGMDTPAGAMLCSNVSVQGYPITNPGVSFSYYNHNMIHPMYTNYQARQQSDLDWMTHEETDILSRYLLTVGPKAGMKPFKREDIAFSTSVIDKKGYVPLCDMRTPGDYSHPMNLALDTSNMGSRYLYMYVSKCAGGRADEQTSNTYEYNKKKYVAAIVCGVGKTPEAAIANLYSKAAQIWPDLAQKYTDIPKNPVISEMDEVYTTDLSALTPWYELHTNDVSSGSAPDDVFIRENDRLFARWQSHERSIGGQIDDYLIYDNCAYIGVIRTNDTNDLFHPRAYGVLKYYVNRDDDQPAPSTLSVGGTECYLAGGPVDSMEGRYFLYYSFNDATAAYMAPITELDIGNEMFINGCNASFTVHADQRQNGTLPSFPQLRMRTDEYKYIHLGYDRDDLPYIEQLYIGVGKNQKEAYADLISTTGAYAATDVNCNYNSFSDKWIAIGFRRTRESQHAVRDIYLYYGNDPPDDIYLQNGYYHTGQKADKASEYENQLSTITASGDTKTEVIKGIRYRLVKHNLKVGAENYSLNEGNGTKGLYIYFTTARILKTKSKSDDVPPITNLCFTYGDISPIYATPDQLVSAFKNSYYITSTYDAKEFEKPHWECVLGVEDAPDSWNTDASTGRRMSLNEGIIPGRGNSGWHTEDHRVYMYVDRIRYDEEDIYDEENEVTITNFSRSDKVYNVRANAAVPQNEGYYAEYTNYGVIKQK